MADNCQFSVVIPVFNEAQALLSLQERLAKAMDGCLVTYEIVYVDDGSTDATFECLGALKKRFANIRIISFRRNRGQSTALYAGFKAARGGWIITLDADLQNPPEEIPKLLAFYTQFDCITGVRQKRNDALMRKIDSRIAFFFRKAVLGDTTRDVGCSLRLFRRDIIDAIPFFRNFHRFFPFLVHLSGFSVKEVPVAHDKRIAGVSKYGTWKRLQEGLADLQGVAWLKKRLITYEVNYED